MRTAWAALGLVTTVAARMGTPFYSPEFDEDLVINELPRSRAVSAPSELKVVDHVLQLQKGEGRSLSSKYVQAIRAAAYEEQVQQDGIAKRAGVSPLTVAGAIYSVPVTIGTNTFQMVVDTGSSDPWIVMSTFSCYDVASHTSENQDYCGFGPMYNPGNSRTFQQIQGLNFNVSYADGENLNGIMGYESISIAGLTVPSQEFGAVNRAAWNGDGVSSGLVGLAYSTLTSAYNGTDPTKDVKGKSIKYPTLLDNIFAQGLAAPIFSIAMSRNTDQPGILAIGGIPNIPHSPYFVTVPIQPLGVNTTGGIIYQYYSIFIDGFAISASQSAQFNVAGTNNPRKTSLQAPGARVIVDSGTTLIYVDNNIAANVAAAFSPPAVYDTFQQGYTVDCDATAPLFGASIGKKVFYVNPADFLFGIQDSTQCLVGIQPNFGGMTILGDVWMKNVLAVFDIGAQQMRFSAREFYDTPTCNGINCVGTM